MLRIGFSEKEKKSIVSDYCKKNNIKKVYIFSPEKFPFTIIENHELIGYKDIIMYKFFYKLLKEIDSSSLIIINECLRVQNRSDLTYNCLRNYLQQTSHQIIFQYLPQIDSFDDFMILYDFDTRTKYKMSKFEKSMLDEIDFKIKKIDLSINPINVSVSQKTKTTYEKQKIKLFENIGLKDPHTIPRNLYLIGGKEKLKALDKGKKYVGRNNRFKLDSIITYKDDCDSVNLVFEFPHSFINFSDYLFQSGMKKIEVLKTDLKVDNWYFQRYTNWINRIKDGYTSLQ